MKKSIVLTASVAGLLVTSLSTTVSADLAEIEAQKSAAITAPMAVSIAERSTGGRSTEVDFDLENGRAIYEIDIKMSNGSEIDVEIDANTGTVLSKEVDY